MSAYDRPGEVVKARQVVPDNLAATLREMRATNDPRFRAMISAAVDQGWTYAALGRALGAGRQSVHQWMRQHRARGGTEALALPCIPEPPRRPVPTRVPGPRTRIRRTMMRVRRPSREITAQEAARLREMWDVARRVNGRTPVGDPQRRISEQLTETLATLRDEGATMSQLARTLGVTPPAIRFRLARHGLRRPPPSMQGTLPAATTQRMFDDLVAASTLNVEAILAVTARMSTVQRARCLGRLLRELPTTEQLRPARPVLRTAFAAAVWELTRRQRYDGVAELAGLMPGEVLRAVHWHNTVGKHRRETVGNPTENSTS